MEHKYQWSLFVDPCKNEQFVIRCDDSTYLQRNNYSDTVIYSPY